MLFEELDQLVRVGDVLDRTAALGDLGRPSERGDGEKVGDENECIPRAKEHYLRFHNEAARLMADIERSVGARLWDSTTTEV